MKITFKNPSQHSNDHSIDLQESIQQMKQQQHMLLAAKIQNIKNHYTQQENKLKEQFNAQLQLLEQKKQSEIQKQQYQYELKLQQYLNSIVEQNYSSTGSIKGGSRIYTQSSQNQNTEDFCFNLNDLTQRTDHNSQKENFFDNKNVSTNLPLQSRNRSNTNSMYQLQELSKKSVQEISSSDDDDQNIIIKDINKLKKFQMKQNDLLNKNSNFIKSFQNLNKKIL